jgi:phosphoglycolate phosphatase
LITHVVFDFDGTLVDSAGPVVRLYNEVADRHGYGRLTAANIGELRGLSVLERCRRLNVPPHRLPWLVMQVGRRYREAIETIGFHDGIPDLLRTLRERGLRVAIVSTNEAENIRAFLRRQSAEAWVDEIQCSRAMFGKARLLRGLMKRAGLSPGELVYVGDEHRDIAAGREVGARTIAVRWGVDAEGRLREAAPDHIAARPADVAAWLGL